MPKKMSRAEELNAKLDEYGKLYRDKYGYGWKWDGYTLTLKGNDWYIHHRTNQDAPVWISRYSTTLETVMREYLQTGKLNEAMLRTGLPPQTKTIAERAVDSSTSGAGETSTNFQAGEAPQLPMFKNVDHPADAAPENRMTPESIRAGFAGTGFRVEEVEIIPTRRSVFGGWYMGAEVWYKHPSGAKLETLEDRLQQGHMKIVMGHKRDRQKDGEALHHAIITLQQDVRLEESEPLEGSDSEFEFPTELEPESVTPAGHILPSADTRWGMSEINLISSALTPYSHGIGSYNQNLTVVVTLPHEKDHPSALEVIRRIVPPGTRVIRVAKFGWELSKPLASESETEPEPESVPAPLDTSTPEPEPDPSPESVTTASDTFTPASAADPEPESVPALAHTFPSEPEPNPEPESVSSTAHTFPSEGRTKNAAGIVSLHFAATRAGLKVLRMYTPRTGIIAVRVKEDRGLWGKVERFKADEALQGYRVLDKMPCNPYAKWTEIELVPDHPITPEPEPESVPARRDTFALEPESATPIDYSEGEALARLTDGLPLPTSESVPAAAHTFALEPEDDWLLQSDPLPNHFFHSEPEPEPEPESVPAATHTFASEGETPKASAPKLEVDRKCAWCGGSMAGKRAHAKTCSDPCRKHLSRLESEIESVKQVGSDTLSQLKSAGKVPLLQAAVVDRIEMLIAKLTTLRESVTRG